MQSSRRGLLILAGVLTLALGPMVVLAASKKKATPPSARATDRPAAPEIETTFVPPPVFPAPGGPGLDASGRPYVGGPFVFRWPLDRVVVTSRFGKKRKGRHSGRYHRGTDFDGNPGEPVVATGPGRVVHAGWFFGYGNLVVVDHHGGFQSRYGHLAEVHVFAGQMVRAGASLGLVGSTGRSTGTHLHFGIYYRGRALDPERLIGTESRKYVDRGEGEPDPPGPAGLEPSG